MTKKIAAIVPALNEEKNIANVLRVLLNSKQLDEVIVVDDGSEDKTAEISRKMGAKVISLPKKGGSGKANAMREGVKRTDAEILVFFDADLIGLCEKHISLLIEPVLKNEAMMCVAIRERKWWGKISKFMIKIDPLSAIAGERAMKRFVFESIPPRFLKAFEVETALNYYCLIKKLPVRYVWLRGLDIIIKEKKWGFWRGFFSRIKMFWQLFWIRIALRVWKKEFELWDKSKII